ncbi:hypothetical protein C2S52_022079 [Perilla frutescens var. hirtella]|nr:hypothetical protein C2S52_022079 [Perilla frutescens var. hirtella]
MGERLKFKGKGTKGSGQGATFSRKDVIENQMRQGKRVAYDVFGFVLALQVWAYEVIPDLGRYCAEKMEGNEQLFPQILRWTAAGFYHYDDLMRFFPAGVHRTSTLTEEEWMHLQRLGLQQRHLSPTKLLEKGMGKAAPSIRKTNLPSLDSTAESKRHPAKDTDNERFLDEDTYTNVTLTEIGANVKEFPLRIDSTERSDVMEDDEITPTESELVGVQREEDVDVGSPSLRKGSCSVVLKSGKSAARPLMPSPSKNVMTKQERREYCMCQHIDALTNLLLFKYNQAKQRFLSGWTLLELLGTGPLMNEDLQNVSGTLIDYVLGKLPREGGLPWAEASKVIGIANVNKNHWVCYLISLEEQRIVVYNSTSRSSNWSLIAKQFENMS